MTVEVDADLGIAMSRRFFLDQLDTQEPIVRIQGTLHAAGESLPFEANLRVSALGGGNVAFAFDVPEDGSMIFSTGQSGSGVIARNGRFSCDVVQGGARFQCADVRSGRIVR